MKRWVLGIIGGLVVLGVIGSITGCDQKAAPTTGTIANQPASSGQITATPQPTSTSTMAPAWREVVRFQGSSNKNTETFSIPSQEWRISWDTKPGQYGEMGFSVFVYKAGGSRAMLDLAVNTIGASKDSTMERGSGDYYLTISTGQPYTVIIEAKY